METCRLSASHVRLGVPLPGNVYDDAGQMLLSKGHVLNSQSQLDALLARGMYVDIATFDANFKAQSGTGAASVAEKKFDPFLLRGALKTRLHRLMRGILEASAKPDELRALADDLIRLADADAEAAIASALLDRDEASYATGHSLRSATLCALAAKRLGWTDERRRSVTGAALTMNLGMLELQQRWLRQTTPLTPAQREQLHAHPQAAADALARIGLDDPLWLAATLQHHERPDGKGYPAGLASPCEEAALLRLVDAFGARASPRADRRASPPAQIVRALYVEEGQGPAGPLVGALVKLLGLYPPGSFVRLANNEAGIVFRHGPAPNAPLVAVVTAGSGTPLMQPVRRETQRKEFAVTAALLADKINVGYDLAKLWIGTGKH